MEALEKDLEKNLDKFKSIIRLKFLRTATHLLGTCCNCTCCWYIFGIDVFCLAFFHDTKLARKPHRTFGYQNYDWNLKTPKNWACAATPKTLTEIRLPLLVSLSLFLSCSFFFALPLFLSFLLRALRWVQFGLTFGFVLISFSFERLDAPQLANWIWIWSWVWSGVWVSLWVEIEFCSRSS